MVPYVRIMCNVVKHRTSGLAGEDVTRMVSWLAKRIFGNVDY